MNWPLLRALLPLLALCVVLWLVVQVLNRFRSRRPGLGPIPFLPAASLLSPAERSFFEVLRQCVGQEFHIFVKVRMEDVLSLPDGTLSRHSWSGRVRQKHLDFVLCDRERICPVLLIELDDSTHQRADVRARDAVKDEILEAAGLPILSAAKILSPK